jgi:predicted metal-dependent hydrolase
MKLIWTEGELGEGLRCYRAQEFFAAHEHWECVWLRSKEPEKAFLQGLIQVAAAFHHLQRDNPRGARSLLHRARLRLQRYPNCFRGIDVASFCKEIDEWLQALDAGTATLGRSSPSLHHDGPHGFNGSSGRKRDKA